MSNEVEGYEVVEVAPASESLILPHSGQLIDPSKEAEVAAALAEIQVLKGKWRNIELQLREILATHASVLGTKTFHVPKVGKVELRNWEKITWDEEKLQDRLRQAGAPEELIDEIVVETCSLKVDARRAERAGKANPAYAEAIAACRFEEPTVPTANFSRG